MHQAQESAAESEAKGAAVLRFDGERGVVELELVEGGTQPGVVLAVGGIQAGEDH